MHSERACWNGAWIMDKARQWLLSSLRRRLCQRGFAEASSLSRGEAVTLVPSPVVEGNWFPLGTSYLCILGWVTWLGSGDIETLGRSKQTGATKTGAVVSGECQRVFGALVVNTGLCQTGGDSVRSRFGVRLAFESEDWRATLCHSIVGSFRANWKGRTRFASLNKICLAYPQPQHLFTFCNNSVNEISRTMLFWVRKIVNPQHKHEDSEIIILVVSWNLS